jgi:signal transduction histidine kinase
VSKRQLFWILQSCGWIAFGAAMFRWGLDFMSPRDALVNKLLLVSLGFSITLLFWLLFRKLRKKVQSPVLAVVCIFAVAFVGAALWREIHSLLFQACSSLSETGVLEVRLSTIPLGTLMYDGFVLFAWSLLYFVITNWMELEDQRERAMEAEAMAQAARLRALQSQLEPHFLFNTLNAISTLVVEGKNAEAARMITRLSEFLRLTLETIDTPEIAVAEELEFVRRYLEIEQVRFGPRLRVTIDAQPEAMSGLVPALILQPLVENAVKHGVLALEEGGSVWVSATRGNSGLRLSVADNGKGIMKDVSAVFGVGLNNTFTRLRELYGEGSRFSLSRSSSGGTEVTMEIPFRSKELETTSGKSEVIHDTAGCDR